MSLDLLENFWGECSAERMALIWSQNRTWLLTLRKRTLNTVAIPPLLIQAPSNSLIFFSRSPFVLSTIESILLSTSFYMVLLLQIAIPFPSFLFCHHILHLIIHSKLNPPLSRTRASLKHPYNEWHSTTIALQSLRAFRDLLCSEGWSVPSANTEKELENHTPHEQLVQCPISFRRPHLWMRAISGR